MKIIQIILGKSTIDHLINIQISNYYIYKSPVNATMYWNCAFPLYIH